MQRYRLPFFNYAGESLEIKFYIEDYIGEIETLTGAPSAFVVTGTDEEFVYEPVRTSTASVSIATESLLNDLFSINNHHVAVKLYRGDKLLWTGYVKPDVLTQAYSPVVDKLSINCISAIGTLENIKYEKQTESGFISAIDLLRYIVNSANGGYEKIYIPHVYGSSEENYSLKRNIFDEITLAEEGFTSEGMMLDEVLEYFCRFFSWTLYDYEGSLCFLDPDWNGEYFAYGEDLITYEMITPNTVLLQDIGFGGSDHTIDVLPGYNKVTVKAINNVFDEMVNEEDYDTLDQIGDYIYRAGERYDRKEFLKAKNWEVYSYDKDRNLLDTMPDDINYDVFGAVLMREAVYTGEGDPPIDYQWEDSIQMRTKTKDGTEIFKPVSEEDLPAFRIKGVNALYREGAIGISWSVRMPGEKEMIFTLSDLNLELQWAFKCSMRIGDNYWNGTEWQKDSATFYIIFEGNINTWLNVKNTKTADMPYRGLNGYVIPFPDDEILIGEAEFTLYCMERYNMGIIHEKLFGYIIRNLTITYKKKDGVVDEGENGDRVYENVVNENFMNELDEIEFGISSYNEDGATYSKALLNGNFLTDNLYSAVEDMLVRPEEALIRRVINRYRVTKIKLTQVLKNSDSIHPFTILYDNSMVSKKFMLLSGVWDYEQNTLTLSMIENGDKVRYKNR
nr:MAG TPA: hypothetical protein [Caudoviricetes sp.]